MIVTQLFLAAAFAIFAEVGIEPPSSNPAGPEITLRSVDGKIFSGNLLELSDSQLKLQQAGGKKIAFSTDVLLDAAPVERVELPGEKKSTCVYLVDGSRLNVDELNIKGMTASIRIGHENYVLQSAAIRNVRFPRSDDPNPFAWPPKAVADAAGDVLVVRKNNSIDFLEGAIEGVTNDHVVFRIDGDSVPVQRSKIYGLIFFRGSNEKSRDPLCVVEDSYGDLIKSQSVLFAADSLMLKAVNAIVLTPPEELRSKGTIQGNKWILIPWESVTRIDFSSGKLLYLSDLEPESAHWTPYLGFQKASAALEQFYAPRKDESREHHPLAVGGKTFAKGLALYSRTEMTYRLPAGAKKFRAVAGIDDTVRETGGVRLEISADGKKLFDKAISGSEEPADIDLDIAGAKRLTILVDYGAGLDAGDYLNLADARILK